MDIKFYNFFIDSVSPSVSEVAFDTNKAFDKKMYQEISSKLDMVIMNQCKLNRYLLPHEKRIVRPTDLPALPLTTKEELKKFEKYLLKDDNLGATVNIFFSFYYMFIFHFVIFFKY